MSKKIVGNLTEVESARWEPLGVSQIAENDGYTVLHIGDGFDTSPCFYEKTEGGHIPLGRRETGDARASLAASGTKPTKIVPGKLYW